MMLHNLFPSLPDIFFGYQDGGAGGGVLLSWPVRLSLVNFFNQPYQDFTTDRWMLWHKALPFSSLY